VADRPRDDAAIDDEQDPSADPVPDTDDHRAVTRFWRELPILLIAALVIAVLIKTFLIQAFYIPSISMTPTLERGDRILVCRICVHLTGVHRGDVIVFSDPNPKPGPDRGPIGGALHWLAQGLGVQQPENEDFVKRVIGLPGDVVELNQGQLYVNGQAIAEPYLNPQKDTSHYGPIEVPDGMLFVLGDNRAHSGDSRYPPPTGVGLVPEGDVIGKAFVIIYPPRRWGWI
jgi:signal peptidase I